MFILTMSKNPLCNLRQFETIAITHETGFIL